MGLAGGVIVVAGGWMGESGVWGCLVSLKAPDAQDDAELMVCVCVS